MRACLALVSRTHDDGNRKSGYPQSIGALNFHELPGQLVEIGKGRIKHHAGDGRVSIAVEKCSGGAHTVTPESDGGHTLAGTKKGDGSSDIFSLKESYIGAEIGNTGYLLYHNDCVPSYDPVGQRVEITSDRRMKNKLVGMPNFNW